MNYKAFYRTYRPNNFDQIIGQDHIVKTLVNLIRMGKISHGYLFSGPRGTGKTSVAKIFANAINCIHSDKPEGICKYCIENSNNSLDIIEIDAASNNSVNDVRVIREQIGFAPTNSPYKIYIIDEVHMLTKSAFNALLMTLEEPPKHAIFIFATTNPDSIPDTILSRVQRYNFKRITQQDLKQQLKFVFDKENIKCDQESYEVISNLANGSLRDALSIADQINAYSDSDIKISNLMEIFGLTTVESQVWLINLLAKKSISEALEFFNNLVDNGADISKLLNSLIQLLKDFIVFKKTNDLSLINQSNVGILETIILKEEVVYKILDILIPLMNEIRYTDIPQQLAQLAIIKICSFEESLIDIEKKGVEINSLLVDENFHDEQKYQQDNFSLKTPSNFEEQNLDNQNEFRDITDEYFSTQNLTQPNDFENLVNKEIKDNQIDKSMDNNVNQSLEKNEYTQTQTLLSDFKNSEIENEFDSLIGDFSLENELNKIKNERDNKNDYENQAYQNEEITKVVDFENLINQNNISSNLNNYDESEDAKIISSFKNDKTEEIINNTTELLNISNEFDGSEQEVSESLLNNYDTSKQVFDTNEISIHENLVSDDITRVVESIPNISDNSENTKEFDLKNHDNNSGEYSFTKTSKMSQSSIVNLFLLSKKDSFPIFKQKLEEACCTTKDEYDSYSVLLKETRFICSANDFILVSSNEDWVIDDINTKSQDAKFKKFISEYFGNNLHFYAITKNEYILTKELFEELKKSGRLPKPKPLDQIVNSNNQEAINRRNEINELENKSKSLFGNIFTRKKE